jgi:hypothetical protein
LITGVIYSPLADIETVQRMLALRLGDIETVSDKFPFDQTDYYTDEMGRGLTRIFCVFNGLYQREFLVDAKLISYELEKEHAQDSRRVVNIDPGIVSLENFILSTFKNYYHRIYLGKGVYGEVTRYYMKNAFRELPWTYPDYRKDTVKAFFGRVREDLYRETIGKGMRYGTEYDGLR